MKDVKRSSGILLHPTSLPVAGGIGTLGSAAFEFIDFLVEAGQSYWQILPLGPTGFGDSPYSSFCSVAGNPLLIDLEQMCQAGDLLAQDVETPTPDHGSTIDFGKVIQYKTPLLAKAARNFLESARGERRQAYDTFCSTHQSWLDPFALFMAIKSHFDQKAVAEGHWGTSWNRYWDRDIALREPAAIERWISNSIDELEIVKATQFFFFEQWQRVREYANRRGVTIIGDMPIFVALDSVDVWNAPEMFQLNSDGIEAEVAGVPPDFFSETGQLWGNPQYDWEAMERTGFRWWQDRFDHLMELVDVIRIDHFRGFEAVWSVPATEETAVNGEWVKVPGQKLFDHLTAELGDLPVIAEDLGVITKEVEALRDRYHMPGMRVLQIGFEDLSPDSPHLPENHVENSVVYTATHDNNTCVGWFEKLTPEHRAKIEKHVGQSFDRPARKMVEIAIKSTSNLAIIPVQDLLELGGEARMNTPATIGCNWSWRLDSIDSLREIAKSLAKLTRDSGR